MSGSHLNPLHFPNPQRDLQDGKASIFVGTCRSPSLTAIDQIFYQECCDVIQKQYTSNSSRVLFDVVYYEKPTYRYSHWQIFKAAIQTLYDKNILWKQAAKLIGLIAMGAVSAFVTYASIRHLSYRYEQISRGVLYLYQSTDRHHRFPIRKYGKLDFYVESALIGTGVLLMNALSTRLLFRSLQARDSILSTFQCLSKMNQDPYYAVITNFSSCSSS